MVSLLCYFLCCVTVVIAATGVLIGFSISAAERVGHYPHPRPVVERNDKEVRVLLSKSRIACEGYRSHEHRIQNMVCDDLPELMQSKGRGEQHVNSRVARLPG